MTAARCQPRNTAGAMASGAAPAMAGSRTVAEAVEEIRRGGGDGVVHYHVYVTDADSKLIGVVSMRDLVLSRPHLALSRVMKAPAVAVAVDDDRDEVARVLRRHDFPAVPVVDPAGRLAGLVTAEDVMDALDEEATEDAQQLFGAGADERLTSPWHFSLRRRLLWLLVNLALALVGASVIARFEATVGGWTPLAMYLPVVAGMGGNAAAQAMAVAVRGIALGQARRLSVRAVLSRELKVGAATGLVTGAVAGCTALALHYDHAPLLGLLVAASVLVNQTVACAWGAGIPLLMGRLGFDPAQSAAIFTTTLTDAVGFSTLLGLATLSLRLLH